MRSNKGIISKVLVSADLDAELEPRLPILEIAGNKRVLIENHQSVIGYSDEYVCVKVNYGSICVNGCGLTLVKMSKEQLVIQGEIISVQLSQKAKVSG